MASTNHSTADLIRPFIGQPYVVYGEASPATGVRQLTRTADLDRPRTHAAGFDQVARPPFPPATTESARPTTITATCPPLMRRHTGPGGYSCSISPGRANWLAGKRRARAEEDIPGANYCERHVPVTALPQQLRDLSFAPPLLGSLWTGPGRRGWNSRGRSGSYRASTRPRIWDHTAPDAAGHRLRGKAAPGKACSGFAANRAQHNPLDDSFGVCWWPCVEHYQIHRDLF